MRVEISKSDFISHVLGKCQDENSIISFIKNESLMLETILGYVAEVEEPYLYEIFVSFFSCYAERNSSTLEAYFLGKITLNSVCHSFIMFFFEKKTILDFDKTLASFREHNMLSDSAIKKAILNFPKKTVIHLLGFGLDTGDYEKELAKSMIDAGIAEKVRIFGFDPYAKRGKDIEYLSEEDLLSGISPLFDIVICRWVLHHIAECQRWTNFIRCINHCSHDGLVLVLEHGFFREKTSLNAKVLHLFTGIFDVLANIGLRPDWFTETSPNFGQNFWVNYLALVDLASIKNGSGLAIDCEVQEVGPIFPNQTLCVTKPLLAMFKESTLTADTLVE